MTDSQWHELEAEMMGLVNTAMQSTPHTRELDAIQEGYHLTSEKRNIRVLVKKSPTSAFHEFLALRRNPLSLDDYMELSYCDTTDALRAQQALFYRDNLLNAMVLAAHQTRDTDPFRFVGLKYKRLRFANSGGVFEPRDTTYFEVSGLRTNKAGHRVLFIARESVNLDDYPPVDHVVRFHFKTLILQTHYDDGIEEAVYLISNPLGSIPAFVFNKVAQASLYLVDDFPLMLQKQRCSPSSQCSIDSYHDGDDDSRDSAGLRSTVSTGNDYDDDHCALRNSLPANGIHAQQHEKMRRGIDEQRQLVHQLMEQLDVRRSLAAQEGPRSS
ncbi:hypothetical protein DYB25_010909 [Aphanomyces astaci]|uniref:START domain-containing protein n=3 Tax=Aphanomyces astaci TaxID=112090 RepID=A0A397BQ98_APHAT|nr:hypothetical protein DYB25_010909 [Aphanomyces astaci]